MEKQIVSIPEARLLLASLRSVGYTAETAVADIIDNCISAHANTVRVMFDWDQQQIIICDDGEGMSYDDLIENMRIGSSDPLQQRASDDLGRFGMGLKTAAFSLGKKLTVITKTDGIESTCLQKAFDTERMCELFQVLLTSYYKSTRS